jgi:hypothetical protein
MQVEVVGSVPKPTDAVQAFSDFAVERAVKSFLSAIDSEDSLFRAEGGQLRLSSTETESVVAGTMCVRFRDEKLINSRGAHFSLIEKLSGLLKQAGSADTLRILLALETARAGAKPEFVVNCCLEARGSSPEQAALRWGLGIAHVQQALLFVSRVLRQELAGAQ